jgi:hypothetical protein
MELILVRFAKKYFLLRQFNRVSQAPIQLEKDCVILDSLWKGKNVNDNFGSPGSDRLRTGFIVVGNNQCLLEMGNVSPADLCSFKYLNITFIYPHIIPNSKFQINAKIGKELDEKLVCLTSSMLMLFSLIVTK